MEGQRLLRVSTKNTASVIDARDGTILTTVKPKVARAEFAGFKDQVFALIPVSTMGAESGTIASIFDLAFHPDRPVLAVATATDLNVKLWHYPSGTLQQTFLGFKGNPVSLSFSPSGHQLAVEGKERSVRIFAVDPMPE